MKYTFNDFRMGIVAVKTGLGKDFHTFMERLQQRGFYWGSGEKPFGYTPRYSIFGENLIIACDEHTGHIYYRNVEYARAHHLPIVSVNDIVDTTCPKRRIIIEFDGDETTANLVVDGEIVKKTTAKRAPCDKFNLRTGAEVAFNRLWEKKEKEEKEEKKEKTDCTQFKVGNRVRFTDKSLPISTGPKSGATGTVIAHDSRLSSWLVQFDEAVKNGHAGRTIIHDDIEPTGRDGYCWWCPNCFIERI